VTFYPGDLWTPQNGVDTRVTLHARQMLLLHWQPTEAQRSA